jgi:hypothetical protein
VTPDIEKRLEDLIAQTPPKRPDGYPFACWCALSRAEYAAGNAGENLVDFAESIGLTFGEAFGVMSGWDLASTGFESMTIEQHLLGYAEGLALGKRLFEKYGPDRSTK